ncbi:hypothetical protein B0H14DRAFT_3888571 [Mycena olivaceomarginata]|nr:hypothetical protein B0H14DRAFT_3888571 [Mycena olivaceomarginata]
MRTFRPGQPQDIILYPALSAAPAPYPSKLLCRSPIIPDILQLTGPRFPSTQSRGPPLLMELSSYTTEKTGGRVKWVYRVPHAAPHAFCVDENPRLTVCTPWDCLPALQTHIASTVFHHLIWRRTAILAAFSHTTSFSVHGVVPVTRLSAHARIIGAARPLLNRNSTKYVQHRICALESTPREACSNTISLTTREMLGVALECPAHPPSTIRSLSGRAPRPKLPNIKRRELAHPQRSLAAPPSVRQSGASSDAPDVFSTVSMLHTTCAATSSAARCPGGHLQHHDSAHDPLQARSTVPATPTGSTPRRRDHKPQPNYQPHAQHATLACLAADDASSPSRTPTTFIASCVRSACDGRSPSPAPLLSPPRAPSASPAISTLPDPHARRALACTTLACAAPAAAAAHPPRHGQLVSGTGSTTRSIAGARSKCNEHSPSPTPPSSSPRAPRLSSAPTPATARNLGLPRTANRTGTTPPCAAHAAAVPHRPIPSPLPTSILSPIPLRSLTPPGGCVCRDNSAMG